jgi:hypothetical protein
MAVGSILSQIAKLVARQKTTKGLIKNAVKNKLPHTKLKAKEKMLDKSIKRLETKASKAKTTSKDPQRLSTEISNKKRRAPDSAKALQFSDPKDAQMARMGSYAGRDKEMVRLREAIKKAKEKPNLSDKAKEELKRNEAKLKDMTRRLGKPADEKKAGGPIVKKPMGGKVYKNTVSRKHGGAIGVGSALRGFGKGYKKG